MFVLFGVVPPLTLMGIVDGSGVPNHKRVPPIGIVVPFGVFLVVDDAVAATVALPLLLLSPLLLLLLLHLYLLLWPLWYALRCHLGECPS